MVVREKQFKFTGTFNFFWPFINFYVKNKVGGEASSPAR